MKLVLALSCFLSSSILSSCSSITDSHSVRQMVREVSSFCSPSSWDLGRKRGKEGGGGGIRKEEGKEERRGRRGKEGGTFFISVKLSQQHTPGTMELHMSGLYQSHETNRVTHVRFNKHQSRETNHVTHIRFNKHQSRETNPKAIVSAKHPVTTDVHRPSKTNSQYWTSIQWELKLHKHPTLRISICILML